ncbi:hypothetical protein M0R45_016615 [Rubus argutus]|uniref:Uncharacterized protein n=1 Tax=Rubus argutus TaxID=59490 RepID=A0AAW1XT40_RUBAR
MGREGEVEVRWIGAGEQRRRSRKHKGVAAVRQQLGEGSSGCSSRAPRTGGSGCARLVRRHGWTELVSWVLGGGAGTGHCRAAKQNAAQIGRCGWARARCGLGFDEGGSSDARLGFCDDGGAMVNLGEEGED